MRDITVLITGAGTLRVPGIIKSKERNPISFNVKKTNNQ